MSNTSIELEAARNAVGNQLGHHICAYTNGMALRTLHAEKEPGFLFSLSVNDAPTPLCIPNSLGYIFNHVRSYAAAEFLAIRQALEICETSPAFIEAFAIMDPLVQEVRRLEAKLEQEQLEYGRKLGAIKEAEDAALEKARIALEKDPALSKLRTEAEAVRPPHIEPPPFRGKVQLAVVPAE
jgi:hypothetical protein